MRSFRKTLPWVPLALVGVILGLDLLWNAVVGETGSIAYALIDLPAHLITCAVGIFAIASLAGAKPSQRFATAALIASVAIDVDHIPAYLGSQILNGSLPRPYSHSALMVLVLVLAALALRRPEQREVCLGLAFGVGTHLFRDLATGPGVPLLWPLSQGVARIPYTLFAGLLLAGALIAMQERPRVSCRFAPLGAAAALLFSAAALGHASAALGSRLPTVAMGAYIPRSVEEPSLIEAYGSQVGEQPVIISTYRDWAIPLIEPGELNAIWDRGAVPLLTWEPWDIEEEGRPFPLAAIAAGRYDPYIEESARAAAAWGHPILLRFAHEMNGSWYPWGRGHRGNSPAVYKAAWRHVVAIFRAAGARNVQWVWTPYVENGGRFPFRRYFPGNRWIDWAGLDGLNGGSIFGWRPFSKIFDGSYRQLVSLTPRPLILAEVGSTEDGGSKALWLSNALHRAVPRLPHIRAIVWWEDYPDHWGDFAANSSSAALLALRNGMALPEYRASRAQLLSTPAVLGGPGQAHRPRVGRR